MDLLRSEFNLSDNVRVVQLFFLMEAGAVMHQFTNEVFGRVSHPTFLLPPPSTHPIPLSCT